MSPQQIIAHYRITSKLGEGGMGAVYRATDTKLGRDVAIKVIPESFAQDHDRMERFAREAQVLASLNHPNIAAIYGVEENAIVMELVEGETLRGPMPLSQALPLIQQLIDALEYAHDKGVVHRDLKPDNIKISGEGRLKVLDFGLAKALAVGDSGSSPTITIRATEAGAILGTAAYMAPEQARGQTVDRRADIWAFGVVVYEMLTGRRLFEGATMSDTLAAVLTKEPDVGAVPVRLRRLLQFCLVKDPRQRLSHISGGRYLLDDTPATTVTRQSAIPWAVAGMLALLAFAGLWIGWRATRPVGHALIRLNADLGPSAIAGANASVAISPDGGWLVFSARGTNGKSQLATRLLDQPEASLLPGTENASDPFFSPDSQWVGFFADGKLKKVAVQGGAPVNICDASFHLGATWSEDGTIIAALGQVSGLSRVSAAGGAIQPLTKLGSGEATHRWPQALPGGKELLFTVSESLVGLGNSSIEAVSLTTGARKILQRGGYFGRYIPSGHLVYAHQGVLFGIGFDAARMQTLGTPIPLLDNAALDAATGAGRFDFSRTGTFIYQPRQAEAQGWPLVWLDASGKTEPLLATPGIYNTPRISPNGDRLAVAVGSDQGIDIFVYDLRRGAMMRITFGAQARVPVWTPDGKHIVFGSTSGGRYFISWIRSDGSGQVTRIIERRDNVVPWSFSPGAARLAYFGVSRENGNDIWTLPLDTTDPDHPKPGKPELFVSTPAEERLPAFSPDGRWIAYRSDESGHDEVYVRTFPSGGGKWQISIGGGLYGLWSNNGRELFYETLDNRIMVLDYTVSDGAFVPGKPRLWSDKQIYYPGTNNLALAPDGKRFAVFPMPEGTQTERGSGHVTFLLNFFDELKRRLPAGRR